MTTRKFSSEFEGEHVLRAVQSFFHLLPLPYSAPWLLGTVAEHQVLSLAYSAVLGQVGKGSLETSARLRVFTKASRTVTGLHSAILFSSMQTKYSSGGLDLAGSAPFRAARMVQSQPRMSSNLEMFRQVALGGIL
jgi:hypothetical protein